MKFLILALALVSLSQASIKAGSCESAASGSIYDIKSVQDTVKGLLGDVMSVCKANGVAFQDLVFPDYQSECPKLFQQGYCFGMNARQRFVDNDNHLSFAAVRTGIKELSKIIDLACGNGCVEKLAPPLVACFQDEATRQLILNNLQGKFEAVQALAKSYLSEADAENPFNALLQLAMDKFTSIDSIVDLAAENLALIDESGDSNRDKIKAHYKEVRAALIGFCKGECAHSAAKHISGVVKDIMNKNGCKVPRIFCGACENNLVSALSKGKNRMPCCLHDIYSLALEKIDLGKSMYREYLSDAALSAVDKILSESSIDEQLACLRSGYSAHVDGICA